MNEFKALLMEAFVGEESFDPNPGRAALEASVRHFEKQERLLRWMMWFSVIILMALAIWSGWTFSIAGADASTKALVLRATLFLFAMQGVGWSKMFLFNTQKELSILKELKRVQLSLLATGNSSPG